MHRKRTNALSIEASPPQQKQIMSKQGGGAKLKDHLAVPLRVPLDNEYSRGSRKLAQVVFKTEMQNKIKERFVEKK